MLQQTQVARVVPAYQRFLDHFPTPTACADAGAAAVLQAWAGLGYNRRALNLQQAAAAVRDHHGGRLPTDRRALEQLPGVGPYTARAVLTFAFEAEVGVVDTNVGRLLARAVAGRPLRPAEAQGLADRLVPAGRAWEWNQALFDLGSAHCAARRPDCRACPLRRSCAWLAAGCPPPDPAAGSASTARPQSAFAGSDRQGRGRLMAALRRSNLATAELAKAAGWPAEPARARRVAEQLVAEGLARWGGGALSLP